MGINRDYISWSSYNLFRTSKREFNKRYVLDIASPKNKFFRKGDELTDFLNIEDYDAKDVLLPIIGKVIPKFDLLEDEIIVTTENGVKIRSFIDSSKMDGSEFIEYKTGKEPWDEERFFNHKQLDFYAAVFFLKFGVIPKANLVWVETKENQDKKLEFTGFFKEFEREFSKKDVLKMIYEIEKTWFEMQDFEYLELDIDDEIMDRYIFLEQQKKEIEDEMNLIKLDLQVQMEDLGVHTARTDRAFFSLVKRENWKYSDDFASKKAEFDKELKNIQEKEKKENIAIKSISSYLKFNFKK